MSHATPQHRFHVHIHVSDLAQNIRFYSELFGAAPAVIKPDYAKWLLDDPGLNFAVSTGQSSEPGIAHLGLEARTAEALQAIGTRLKAAAATTVVESDVACCYARSNKVWVHDPQGLRWETFHTHGEATTYYNDSAGMPVQRETCCGPASPSSGNACTSHCTVDPSEQVAAPGRTACCT